MGVIVNTRPWRRILEAYCVEHSLPLPGEAHGEAGWETNRVGPFLKPGRHVIQRVSNNLVARDLITAEQNDGTLNQAVQDALKPPLTPGQRAVAYAMTQRGVHESPWGSNRGADVTRYQSSTGAYGQPWCASFTWYCWQKAGYTGRTSAGAWYSTDHLGTPIANVHSARTGDQVSLNLGAGHVGLLLEVHQNSVTLIAGNTNNSVKEKDYSIASIHSICRPHV